jgi:hypothetical protein
MRALIFCPKRATRWEGDEVSATQARFKTAADPRQRGTEAMRGVTIPVITTGRKEKKNTALFSMQCILIDISPNDHPPSRFRFVGIPHGAPPPPLY